MFFSFYCDFCGIDLKGRKKTISGVRHVKKIQFPKVTSDLTEEKDFHALKDAESGVWERLWMEKTLSFSKILGNNF